MLPYPGAGGERRQNPGAGDKRPNVELALISGSGILKTVLATSGAMPVKRNFER
ncbi:MAG: hypothetical protein ABI234_00970 [Ktedonobacteraceae bacterium]